tara:strand:+ start:4761 stop:5120 length:360 start_codon:yes stop_codon:yes gene_type:complete
MSNSSNPCPPKVGEGYEIKPIDALLIASAFTLTLSYVPQIVVTCTLKRANDVSLGMFYLALLRTILWFTYKVLVYPDHTLLIACTALILIMRVFTLILISYYRKYPKYGISSNSNETNL